MKRSSQNIHAAARSKSGEINKTQLDKINSFADETDTSKIVEKVFVFEDILDPK